MSLDSYLRLSLTPGSELASALLTKVPTEASRRRISLTPKYAADGSPSFLTPVMNAWYNANINSVRRGALQEVIEYFSAMTIPKSGLRGRLLEHEQDKLDLEAAQKIAEERRIFEQGTDITDVHRDLGIERQRYDALVQQHGEAVKWRPWLYVSVLVFMIFVLEGLINFESFLKIPGFTPALSVGSFLGVSTAFAVSAHFVGLILKQWRELLGGSVSRTERMKTKMLLSLALILFLLAFGFVVYARWALLGDVILRRSQTTGEEVGTEEVLRFAGTLIGNLIVYVMGVVWSYARHDAVPGFAQLRNRVEGLDARESELLGKQLASRNRRHMNKAQSEKENQRKMAQAQAAQLPDYHAGRKRFDQLREQDARVVALLEEYRSLLLDKAGDNRAMTFVFDDAAKVAVDTEEIISPDQYSAISLELRYV